MLEKQTTIRVSISNATKLKQMCKYGESIDKRIGFLISLYLKNASEIDQFMMEQIQEAKQRYKREITVQSKLI